jgi:two-component sensor histidine kinase
LDRLIDTLMVIALEHAGADRGLLITPKGNELWIEAEASTGRDAVTVDVRRVAATPSDFPASVIHAVIRTRESVLIDDVQSVAEFSADDYFRQRPSRSILCIPLVKQTELTGLLYLENSLTPYVFTPARTGVLKLLASQAAISLQNASLEEKEALLKEIHHRVKNNLQLISSLLSLQASKIADPSVAELFADSRNRVRSMALVHENLYRAGNFARISMEAHIQNLCAHLVRVYGGYSRNVKLVTDVEDLQLGIDRAVSCGLIINELVSNALKHAFPDDRTGRVEVALSRQGEKRCVLTVRDDGVGLPPGYGDSDTLGLQLIQDLTQQLRGNIAVSHDRGTSFTISFETDARRETRR